MRSFLEAIPNVSPGVLALSKENYGCHHAILFRMKAVFSLAQTTERCPFFSTTSLWVSHRIVQPEQEATNFIRIQESIKEGRAQWSLFFQTSNRFIGQFEQRTLQCLFCSCVCTDFNAQATLRGLNERSNRPITPILMCPEHSPILELSKRLKHLWRFLDGS